MVREWVRCRVAGAEVWLVGLGPPVGVADGVEAGERFVEFVAGDGVVVDVELGENGLVEQAALFVVARPLSISAVATLTLVAMPEVISGSSWSRVSASDNSGARR